MESGIGLTFPDRFPICAITGKNRAHEDKHGDDPTDHCGNNHEHVFGTISIFEENKGKKGKSSQNR
jgi:hypothetical protein